MLVESFLIVVYGMYVCVYVCVYVCMYLCLSACVRACVRTCVRACMRGCVCVYTCSYSKGTWLATNSCWFGIARVPNQHTNKQTIHVSPILNIICFSLTLQIFAWFLVGQLLNIPGPYPNVGMDNGHPRVLKIAGTELVGCSLWVKLDKVISSKAGHAWTGHNGSN